MRDDLYPTWSTELLATPDGGAVLRPGDTLIIRINSDRHIPPEVIVDLRAAARRAFPDLADVAVINADGFAIYRPDPPNPKADS